MVYLEHKVIGASEPIGYLLDSDSFSCKPTISLDIGAISVSGDSG